MGLEWDHPLMIAAKEGFVDEAKRNIGMDNSLTSQDLTEVAIRAGRYNQIDVIRLLLDAGWDINTQEAHSKSTILMYSLEAKEEKMAKWLLQHGADANLADKGGVAPLAEAALCCSLDMVRTLLEYGARVSGSRSLAAAAVSKNPERVEKLDLLLQHGAEVDEMVLEFPSQTQSGRVLNSGTALHAACKWGFEDSECYLLAHGADPELKTSNGLLIDDLKRRQNNLAGRGWSACKVSSIVHGRLSDKRKKEREALPVD